jgi:primosomal protein N' (replication factor Y)
VGTEGLTKLLEKNFKKKGLRLDTDSAKAAGSLKNILESFGRGEADFLVGTQMAAKGHDFSNLTLVGVIEADLGLNFPDFRAAERTFQLLSQVSGRAGRGERPGLVFIQTRNPSHYVMEAVKEHNYEAFYKEEIAVREELGYPPFSRLCLVRFSGPEEKIVFELARAAAEKGQELIGERKVEELEILGPAPSPVSKLKEKYRFQLLLRAQKAQDRHWILKLWLPEIRKSLPAEVTLTVDIDPYNMM